MWNNPNKKTRKISQRRSQNLGKNPLLRKKKQPHHPNRLKKHKHQKKKRPKRNLKKLRRTKILNRRLRPMESQKNRTNRTKRKTSCQGIEYIITVKNIQLRRRTMLSSLSIKVSTIKTRNHRWRESIVSSMACSK